MTRQITHHYNRLSVALGETFPYRYHKNLLRLAVLQFLVVFLFLYLFRPFGYNADQHRISYAATCFFQALSPALIVFVYFLVINRFKKTAFSQWTLGLQLLHSAIVLFLIGIASFFLRALVYYSPELNLANLGTELKNVYLAGSLFVAYLHIVHNRTKPVRPVPKAAGQIAIKTETKKDDFILQGEYFAYAKSEGNYIDFYREEQGMLQKELKRISLKNFESQLKPYPQFMRCHRAYLVNTARIVKITGNAQGYLLSLKGTDEKIPVSRTYLPLFEPLLSSLKRD